MWASQWLSGILTPAPTPRHARKLCRAPEGLGCDVRYAGQFPDSPFVCSTEDERSSATCDPMSRYRTATEKFDSLIEWTLAYIIADRRATDVGLDSLEEVRADPATTRRRTFLERDAIHQDRLPIREGCCGLVSRSDPSGPAFIVWNALFLAKAVTASTSPRVTSYPETLPHWPAMQALVDQLST